MDPREDVDQFFKLFGQRVKELRKLKKLTQLDLGILSDIDRRQVRRVEKGKINTSARTIYLIAKGLEVPIADLFTFDTLDNPMDASD